MPWRDPENFPLIYAAISAMVTAFLRNMYFGGRGFKVYLFESLLIGTLVMGVGFGLKGLGANSDYVYFIGAMIALFGVDFVRDIGMAAAKRKADKL